MSWRCRRFPGDPFIIFSAPPVDDAPPTVVRRWYNQTPETFPTAEYLCERSPTEDFDVNSSSDSISKSVENSERKLQDSWGRVREGSDDSAIADPSRIVVRSQKIAREIHVSLGPSNPQELLDLISSLTRHREAVILTRKDMCRPLWKLAKENNRLPAFLFLEGVCCENQEAVSYGGYADIYRGKHRGVDVALKRLRLFSMLEGQGKVNAELAFYKEVLVWRVLDHEHITPFLGVDKSTFKFAPCMVLPWMNNGNVNQYIQRKVEKVNLVGPEYCATVNKLLMQISSGLTYLHSECIIHGDLRGVNVLIDDDECARLTDFGLSIFSETSSSSSLHTGASEWLAPELFDPERFGMKSARSTPMSDVYSFGTVCVELYSRRKPFSDDNLRRHVLPSNVLRGHRPPRPEEEARVMPDDVLEVTNMCWKESPSARPTAHEVATTLQSIVEAGDT